MSNQKPASRASAPKIEAPAAPAPIEAPFAYAIIEGPPGKWSAVCLEGVTARAVERLEPNGEPEAMAWAMRRVTRAIEIRTVAKKWRAP